MTTDSVNVFEFHDYRDYLSEIYSRRSAGHDQYSMRAFSRDLGLRHTAFHDILKRRYGVSSQTARKISRKLGLTDGPAEYFVCLVEKQHARSTAAKKAAELRMMKYNRHPMFKELSKDAFEIFSKWYYIAIVELVSIHKGKVSAEKLASLLSISSEEAADALERLQRCGLLSFDGKIWNRNTEYYSVESPTPSTVIRSFHKQVMALGQKAIEEQQIGKRAFVSSIFSFNTKTLATAIDHLKRNQDEFIGKFENGRDADSVFAVSFQLFRLDQEQNS